jgi:hypothetical protein
LQTAEYLKKKNYDNLQCCTNLRKTFKGYDNDGVDRAAQRDIIERVEGLEEDVSIMSIQTTTIMIYHLFLFLSSLHILLVLSLEPAFVCRVFRFKSKINYNVHR